MFLTHALRAISRAVVAVADPYFKYVTMLLHGDGTNGAQNNTFVDSSSNNFTITRAGNATQGTFSPYGESWSNYFDGTGDWLSFTGSPATTLSGDYTFECWINPSNLNANQPMMCIGDDFNLGLGFFILTSGKIQLYGNSAIVYTSTGASVQSNNWTHIAVVRSGTTLTGYINGVAQSTTTSSATYSGTFTQIGREVYNTGTGVQFVGYISNLRLVKGTAVYTSAFTPPTAPLTAISGTSLLTCQSNSLVDNSPNAFTITKNGDVSVQRFSPFPGVTLPTPYYSAYFDGTGDYLDLPNNSVFSQTGSWTLELWVYPTVAINNYVYSQNTANFLQINISGTNYVYIDRSGVGNLIVSTNPISLNVWTHIALVSDGTNMKLFLNGTQSGSTAAVGTQAASATTTRIGAYQGTGGLGYQGYVSNLRLVKGTALYTSAFTPPTAPLTAISGTSLLTCQSNTFVDNSSNAFTITAYGDAKPRQYSPFTPTYSTGQSYTPAVFGGSAYFDGTGDTLNLPSSSALLGSGSYTVEFWVNLPSAPTGGAYFTVFAWGASGNVLRCFLLDSSGTYLGIWVGTGNVVNVATTAMIGRWAHIAICRNGTSMTTYINGVSVATSTEATNFNTGQLYIGSQAGASYFTGYISDFRIVTGTAVYTSNFVPSLTPLTAITNTQLLLKATNAGIFDSAAGNDLETVGNAQISTSVKKYGTGSVSYNGTNSALAGKPYPLLNFGSGDFTVEAWVYMNVTPSSQTWLLSIGPLGSGGVSRGWGIRLHDGSTAGLSFVYTNSGFVTNNFGSLPSATAWHHIAFCRSGTVMRCFVDGNQLGSTWTLPYSTIDATISTDYYAVGAYDNTNNGYPGRFWFNGYIDDLRITTGYARYVANFTPPTAAFPDIGS